MTKHQAILQIKVTLKGIRPPIWRRIQVPASYSFWDLHVAIQDAMGWFDYHLHEFRIATGKRGFIAIGIPDEEMLSDLPTEPGWEVPILRYLSSEGASADYDYDFGDGWEHKVLVEKVLPRVKGVEYPRCINGRRKCPPEDVGGTGGYENFLSAIHDPNHKEYESYLVWVGGEYDPEDFEADSVQFDDPETRWKMAFQDEYEDED